MRWDSKTPFLDVSQMPEEHPFLGQQRPMFFLDVETDGLAPDAQVWDIGFVKASPDGTLERFQTFLEIDLGRGDPKALNIGRFWERSPQSLVLPPVLQVPEYKLAYDHESVAQRIFKHAHGATLAGIVPSADAQWVGEFLRTYGGLPVPWHYKLFDVHTYACGVLSWVKDADTTQWTTEQVSEALNLAVPDQVRHTAIGDAELAFQMYVAARTLVVRSTRCFG